MTATEMNLLDILAADSIKVPLAARDKKGAIEELVDLLAERGKVRDAEALKEAVWERELQRSTGIGEGLAIPHGKTDSVERLVMAIGIAEQPMDFGSVDRKPVRMIVLLASPPDRTSDHIQALGKLSRLLSNPATREAAYDAESPEALLEALTGQAG